ncbi:MAG TPA: metal-binding protein [Rhodospirillaceae bacterium]|nr:metal-binding protein [Rhodospirillaceae bacterium]
MTIRNRIQAAIFAVLLSAVTAVSTLAADRPDATIIKNPQCGCCESYADYLRENGFKVTVKASHDLTLMKREMGVPDDFAGCHTMVLDKYVVEGHVPVSAIDKLLAERPDIKGISLPGMPQGSPGMSGTKTAPFTVYQFGQGPAKVFTVE